MTDKLIPIHDCIFYCRSGSAADTHAVADAVTCQLGFHSIELNEPLLVHTAASLFKEMCYQSQEDLMAGIIIAGWDPQEGGQVRYSPRPEHWSHAFDSFPTPSIFSVQPPRHC